MLMVEMKRMMPLPVIGTIQRAIERAIGGDNRADSMGDGGSEADRLHPNRLSYCSIRSRLVQMPFGLFLSQAPLCRIAAWWASVT